jgi:hypothetical protein
MAAHKRAGARYGRPRLITEKVRRDVVTLREQGGSYASIAARLNERDVPTAGGGRRWYASTVRSIVEYREPA